MHIQVLAEGDEQALTDLRAWLRRGPSTAGLRVETVIGDGPTMGVLEALDVVLSNATAIANFAVAYATWRTTRPTAGTSGGARTMVHGDSTIDISGLSAEELAELLRRLNSDSGDGVDTDTGSS
ncbi:effector-associated constant component EACC1 [Streptomyces sp. enrichment culture]|uniref:effector-associated constant component EACC1 n=1 Tax=Streptomyces sp. enrichment culture TaxID=1795815 RepID=UPI003F55C145